MAAGLFESCECSQWRACLDSYEEVVSLVTSEKKRSKGESLMVLDKWFQSDLPSNVASRSKPHLTHEELCRLMKWKLTRGKFRPRLTELVQQNSSADVETTTAAAITALPDLERAVATASKLKAVGPATASAILCAASPDVPFMADESAQAVPGLERLTYTLKQYMTYANTLQEKATQLSKTDSVAWSAHQVELALWSCHHSARLQPTPQPSVLGKRGREMASEDHGELSAKKTRPSNSP